MINETKRVFEVKWCIENIKSWLKTRHDSIFSPSFLAESLMNTRWKLRVSPNWQLAEKYVGLTLQRDVEDDHLELIDLNYEISLLACDGSSLRSKRYNTKFAPKTVSHKLNVKQDVLLDIKNGAYLSKGVVTVCCKLWMKSMVSKEGQCSLRSVIGTQKIILDQEINNISLRCKVPLRFMPPSPDIKLISLDVNVSENRFEYKTKQLECKNFNWFSCKLFAVNHSGKKSKFHECIEFTKYSTSVGSLLNNAHFYLSDNILKLELEITYNPGIISEGIESKSKQKLPGKVGDLQNLNVHDLEMFPNLSRSNYEDELSVDDEFNDEDDSGDDSESIEEEESINEVKCIDEDKSIEEDESCDKDKSNDKADYFSIAGKKNPLTTTLKEDLVSLYNDRLFCDTKLQTDTETFCAHKNVLCARSVVFKKMFTTDMKEKAGECINISDISADTIRHMLQFIYTDCTEDLDMQSSKDLYVAADKYDITSLKEHCSCFLKSNLSVTNVCEVLVLADMHHDKDLESAAQEFILRKDKEVFKSDEWKLFMKNFSILAAGVMYLQCMKE